MRLRVRCQDSALAARVLELAQQDLQRVPHPAEPDEGAPNYVSGAAEVVGGAECVVDVKGDPLLEDLFLQYVHARTAAAGLPQAAVIDVVGDATATAEEAASTPPRVDSAAVAGPGGKATKRLIWPDGSNGMVLTLELLAALPVQPRDELQTYQISRDVLTVVVDLPARSDLERRTADALDWLHTQGATDLRMGGGGEPTPRHHTWAWMALFHMPGGVSGDMRLEKEPRRQARLTLRLESTRFTPVVNVNRPTDGRRQLLFDATASGHRELRQRFDVAALMKGAVWRLDSDEQVTTRASQFVEQEYLVHSWDASSWQDAHDMRLALAATMGLPDRHTTEQLQDWLRELAVYGWGHNASSFLRTGTVFAITGFAGFADRCASGAAELLDQFTLAARVGIVAGHPMLAVVAAPPLDALFREHSILASYDPPYGPAPLFAPGS